MHLINEDTELMPVSFGAVSDCVEEFIQHDNAEELFGIFREI
jgi:hypothetical protein